MIYLILSLVVLGVIAALLGYISHRKTGEEDVILEGSGSCNTCSGENESCIHDCLLEASVKEIEYFEDEHLDAFSGKSSEDYTEEEVEMFAEVLYTMNPKEVNEWVHSLSLRNINVPNVLKDEVIMMIDSK